MSYDKWENIGQDVLDTLDKYEQLNENISKDITELKEAISSLKVQVWTIAFGIGIAFQIGRVLV